ncbi:hypothetical protein K466DRAFT_546175 [Polyporus arcularius HHB13444]|uniref:Uncharacterized protein n=1 Tax=Polyporus arcularius HHB13444 TaxID=1314778 RepID=A0A5C3PGS2_9APHY|nr:hypothetical protein K466DRAFT_546175 [Polyporus arcularius HHB13444]
MESLNNLATSLPSSRYANAEKELTDNFRAAAMSLTTLYRSSKTASKRAYNAGYASACHDLLNMIQQGVSTEADPSREVTIGRIMDYIEARLEAIKAREEEEDEEEERVTKGVAGPSAPKTKPASPTPASSPVTRREQMVTAPPTPYTPSMLDTSRPYAPPGLASPTPSVLPLRPMSAPFQSISRASKSRLMPSINPKDLSPVPLPSATFDAPAIADVTVHPAPTEPSMTLKRRREDASHSGSEAAANGADTSRRRTRSNRGENQLSAGQGEAMDVEEEGPQRKRVARR